MAWSVSTCCFFLTGCWNCDHPARCTLAAPKPGIQLSKDDPVYRHVSAECVHTALCSHTVRMSPFLRQACSCVRFFQCPAAVVPSLQHPCRCQSCGCGTCIAACARSDRPITTLLEFVLVVSRIRPTLPTTHLEKNRIEESDSMLWLLNIVGYEINRQLACPFHLPPSSF